MSHNNGNYNDSVDTRTVLNLLSIDYASVEAQLRKENAILKAQLLKSHQKISELQKQLEQKGNKNDALKNKSSNNN